MNKKKKHVMKVVERDSGYCGDHYCTGHTDHFLVCTCGFKKEIFPDHHNDSETYIRSLKLEHLMEAK